MNTDLYLPADLYEALADFILTDPEAQRALKIERNPLCIDRSDVMIALAERLDLYPREPRSKIGAEASFNQSEG